MESLLQPETEGGANGSTEDGRQRSQEQDHVQWFEMLLGPYLQIDPAPLKDGGQDGSQHLPNSECPPRPEQDGTDKPHQARHEYHPLNRLNDPDACTWEGEDHKATHQWHHDAKYAQQQIRELAP